ncbi:MAG: acyl-CoA dehydrogenase family protein, partial [Burkholderiaceae bacterium]|nr:acyl-CoA dehydrogenase family protein [Burkholderiaceae bacterium]
ASCWEASGAIAAAYEQTVAHTRQRRQFGQAVADFQVIQHRLAEMAVCRTEARAACELASLRIERGDADDCAIASAAKVKVGRCADYVAKEAVQLHGAIGTTDELPIASYFRRLTVFNTRGGSPQSHARALGQRMIASGTWRESQTLGAPQAQQAAA